MLSFLNKNIMDDITFKEVEGYLLTLVSQMDVPKFRIDRKDWRWVNRNLYIRNADHELFDESVILLKKILEHNAKRQGRE
jgi:hypothetical protein